MGDALQRGDDEAAAPRGGRVSPLHGGSRGPGLRRLVVTGDDFGFSRGVNRAIREAHDRGILTSSSIMVTGEAFDDAVAIARSRPSLAVGLHLVLAGGRAALPPAEIPALVDGAGEFPSSPLRAGLRFQFRGAARSELRREIRAQLDRFRAAGLPLSHVDGHHHLHLHPVVLGILADLAAEYGISAVRLPAEELSTALALDRSDWARNIVWAAVFRALRRSGERRMDAAGVSFADRVYGLFQTGKITEEYLLRLLPRIRGRRVEIYAHPAVVLPGEPLNGPPGAGEAELEALMSPRVRAAIDAGGIARATCAAYRETPAFARSS